MMNAADNNDDDDDDENDDDDDDDPNIRHQILQIPVMPDATPLLQTLDTHLFASLKQHILEA